MSEAISGGARPRENPAFRFAHAGYTTITSPMPYSLVIFDLDGTLADSFPWFRRNVNNVADTFGFRRVGEGEIEPLRHAGAREVLARLNVPPWEGPVMARHMRHVDWRHAVHLPA